MEPLRIEVISARLRLWCVRGGSLRAGLALGLAMAWLLFCTGAYAADPNALYAVVHVDLDSSRTSEGVAILDRYVQHCRSDAGNLSMTLLQETGRANHLTLIEGWRTEKSYTAHLRSRYSTEFREKIQPLLGSPFDERLHHEIGR